MNNELSFKDFKSAVAVVEILINNGYVCMISVEEHLWIVNYEFGVWDSRNSEMVANRNGVVFMTREEFDDKLYENSEDISEVYNFNNEKIGEING